MTHAKIKEYIITHRPAAAYLGRLEMKAFTDEAERDGYFVKNVTCAPDLHRLEYCQCALYQVDSESHAGFGQNDTSAAAPAVNSTNKSDER